MPELAEIGVVGAGAWGTALAQVAAASGGPVRLWAREADLAEAINQRHENAPFLPGVEIDPAVIATSRLADLAAMRALLLVVPTQFLRAVCRELARSLKPATPLVVCAKGIELGSGLFAGEIVAQELPGHPLAILSGPTFALEVARGLPTAVTLATDDPTLGAALVTRLGRPTFRPYLSDDPVGAEIGGAVKNVLAIACGIVLGRGLGDNARAALITRGLAEMLRLGQAKGAKAETLMGLSGLGDLVLTCAGEKSRNMTLGRALGEGRPLADILAERRSVAEGVASAPPLVRLAQKLGIVMPISEAVDAILHGDASIDERIEALLARPFKAETAGD